MSPVSEFIQLQKQAEKRYGKGALLDRYRQSGVNFGKFLSQEYISKRTEFLKTLGFQKPSPNSASFSTRPAATVTPAKSNTPAISPLPKPDARISFEALHSLAVNVFQKHKVQAALSDCDTLAAKQTRLEKLFYQHHLSVPGIAAKSEWDGSRMPEPFGLVRFEQSRRQQRIQQFFNSKK